MEITLIQGLMLAVMAIIVGLDFFLEAFFIFQGLLYFFLFIMWDII